MPVTPILFSNKFKKYKKTFRDKISKIVWINNLSSHKLNFAKKIYLKIEFRF